MSTTKTRGGTMKTAYRTAYGPPEVIALRELPVLEPRHGEILVRVHTATVDRIDYGALWVGPTSSVAVLDPFGAYPVPRTGTLTVVAAGRWRSASDRRRRSRR